MLKGKLDHVRLLKVPKSELAERDGKKSDYVSMCEEAEKGGPTPRPKQDWGGNEMTGILFDQ